MDNKIDFKGVIERLKRELNLKYDTELSKLLGKDEKYVSVIKGRNTFGGEVWMKVFMIADKNDISLDWLIFGKLGKGMSANDVVRNTIIQTISDDDERKRAISRLNDAMVSYQNVKGDDSDNKVLDLALRLISALATED